MPAYHPTPDALIDPVDRPPADTLGMVPKSTKVFTDLKSKYAPDTGVAPVVAPEISVRIMAGASADIAKAGLSTMELNSPAVTRQLDAVFKDQTWMQPMNGLVAPIREKASIEKDLQAQFKEGMSVAEKLDTRLDEIKRLGGELRDLTNMNKVAPRLQGGKSALRKDKDKKEENMNQLAAVIGEILGGISAFNSEAGAKEQMEFMKENSLGVKPGMKPQPGGPQLTPELGAAKGVELGAGASVSGAAGAAGAAAAVNPVIAAGMIAAQGEDNLAKELEEIFKEKETEEAADLKKKIRPHPRPAPSTQQKGKG